MIAVQQTMIKQSHKATTPMFSSEFMSRIQYETERGQKVEGYKKLKGTITKGEC